MSDYRITVTPLTTGGDPWHRRAEPANSKLDAMLVELVEAGWDDPSITVGSYSRRYTYSIEERS